MYIIDYIIRVARIIFQIYLEIIAYIIQNESNVDAREISLKKAE